jgi:DNA-directed RNA polymerase beta subunit
MATKLTPIYSTPEKINEDADKALVDSLKGTFPLENKNYILNIDNIKVNKKIFSRADEKDAILRSKSLVYPIKGDITLISKTTGKPVDHVKDFSLMDAFHITSKHTIMYNGNNYSVANQLQLLPGVYTRTRENTGELEAHFNTAKGASFKIVLDPKLKVFFLEVGTSHTPIGPLLTKVFHVSEAEATKYIPKDVWEANIAHTMGKEDKIIRGLYSRMVYTKSPSANVDEMAVQLKAALEASELSAETTQATLGKSFTGVEKEALLRTMRNLVEVHRGDRQEDNRDSLQFKRVQNLPDYLRTRFAKDHESVRKVKNKISYGLEKIDPNNPKISDAVASKPFNKIYSSYITGSSLISTPSETNPIESLETVGKVTVLGPEEGGISSARGVPMAARNIDPSHLAILDPSRTPESGHAGIDQRFTISARRDAEGRLYAKVLDKNMKPTHISVTELMNSVIGFPDQKHSKDSIVEAQDHGEMRRVPRNKVDYWINDATDLYTVTTNLVPFLNSNHPGRLTMAGKALPQALSLVNREVPLVQTLDEQHRPFVKTLNNLLATGTGSAGGTVVEATNRKVKIKRDDGTVETIEAVKNLPFNMKGFHDDETPLVQVGDKVRPHQPLFENNYTKDGHLALGKNLTAAYMPYKGYNHEDGIVISESAAKSLSSHHAYKVDYEVSPDTVARKALLRRYFPDKFTTDQLNKLDDLGYAKVGAIMHYGDPVYAVLERREPTPEDRLLGRLHKSLVNPYRLVTEIWNHAENGEVVDSHTDSKNIRILLRSVKELEVGDKLTGLHGNKGIVSLILPDHEMPTNKTTGKAVDLVLNPASVTSRINLGQIMETVAGKIAQKTGKPYLIKNFEKENNLQTLKKEMESHGVSDTDELVDPKTGHSFGKIFNGPQYIIKLYKTTDQNYSARNVGGYDNMLQPTKGGEEGSKRIGYMEMLGLLGSDARKNLKEITTTKSEQNEEYWTKFIRGEPLPKPKMTFATQKFLDYLKGSGVNVKIEDGKMIASPMTDHEILHQSNGEIKEPLALVAKNLSPEDGGLFDQVITGGLKGDKWSHYKLAEPMVNPVFENPVKSILGLSSEEFAAITSGKYGVQNLGSGHFRIIDTASDKEVRTFKVG